MSAALAEAPATTQPAPQPDSQPTPQQTRTVVVRPAPDREPPFDDERTADARTVGRLDRPLPFARTHRRRAALPPPPHSAARALLPDPALWARRLLLGIIETADGRRPLNQLSALLSPGVSHGLRSEFALANRLGRPHWTHRATIRSVRASEPADQVAELCATVRTGERVRAVALRLEVRHERWCCTRLVLG